MAKIQIKFEKLTPFGGIFSIMEDFHVLLSDTIDSTFGLHCKWFGYQYFAMPINESRILLSHQTQASRKTAGNGRMCKPLQYGKEKGVSPFSL